MSIAYDPHRPIVDHATALAMVNLLDWLYKSGVYDAEDADDDGLCRDYLERTATTCVFGFLGDSYSIGWQEWVLRLTMQARRTTWNGPMNRFMALAGKYGQNYLGVFYLVALEWYRMGIRHYIDAPTAMPMPRFKADKKIWWYDSPKNRIIKTQEFIDQIQQQCFDLERKHVEAAMGKTQVIARKMGILPPRHFELFRRVMGLAAMKR